MEDAGSIGVFQRAVRRVEQIHRSTLCMDWSFPRLNCDDFRKADFSYKHYVGERIKDMRRINRNADKMRI